MLALFLAQTAAGTAASTGVGLEWMPIAAVVIPAVLLVAIWWYGSRNAV